MKRKILHLSHRARESLWKCSTESRLRISAWQPDALGPRIHSNFWSSSFQCAWAVRRWVYPAEPLLQSLSAWTPEAPEYRILGTFDTSFYPWPNECSPKELGRSYTETANRLRRNFADKASRLWMLPAESRPSCFLFRETPYFVRWVGWAEEKIRVGEERRRGHQFQGLHDARSAGRSRWCVENRYDLICTVCRPEHCRLKKQNKIKQK